MESTKFSHAREYHILYIVHTFGKRNILAPLIFKNGIYLINEIKKVSLLYIMEPFYALCMQLVRFRVVSLFFKHHLF